jgi:hypothetical protein
MKVSDEWGARGRALDRKERKKIGNKKKRGVETVKQLTFFFFFFVSLQTSQTAANNNYNSKFSTGIVSIYYRR